MGWFQTRCRWWEIVLLLAATFALFRPNLFMDLLYAPYEDRPATELLQLAGEIPQGYPLVMVLEGSNIEGSELRKTVSLQLGKPAEGRVRLADAGLTLRTLGGEVAVAGVKFGSKARRAGFEQGWKVAVLKVPAERPSPHWIYIPALILVALVFFLQRLRRRSESALS
jgi:hypothetical protein